MQIFSSCLVKTLFKSANKLWLKYLFENYLKSLNDENKNKTWGMYINDFHGVWNFRWIMMNEQKQKLNDSFRWIQQIFNFNNEIKTKKFKSKQNAFQQYNSRCSRNKFLLKGQWTKPAEICV